jgi:iron(III) transport system permease protein
MMESKSDGITKFTIFIIAVLISIFVIYPLYKVIVVSLTVDGSFSLSEYIYIFSKSWLRGTFYNSMILGVIVATTSTIIGFITAYSLYKVQLPMRGFFRQIVMLPIISPPFMLTISIILLMGRNGLITKQLLGITNYSIYGLDGLIIVQTLGMYPIAYRVLTGVLSRISPELENAALNLGGDKGYVFRSVTLPLSIPGLASAWLLVFVTSIADFANPMVLAGNFDVLSVQAYMQFTGMYNLSRGSALAIMLLFPALLAFVIEKYWVSKKSYITVTGKPTGAKQDMVSSKVKKILMGFLIALTSVIFLFYFTVIMGSFFTLWGVDFSLTLEHFKYSWDVGLESIKDTLILAGTATPFTGLLGMIIAFLIVRKSFWGKNLLQFSSLLSFAVPGTVIGIGYVLAFNEKPFILTGTAAIIILNLIFRNMPVGIESGVASLRQIDPAIEEASTDLGASSAYTFSKITLPLIKPAFFSGLSYSFVRGMTAVSAIIFLVSARWNHLTALILAQTEIMRLGAASVLSLVLIIIVMSVFYLLGKLVGDDEEFAGMMN